MNFLFRTPLMAKGVPVFRGGKALGPAHHLSGVNMVVETSSRLKA